MARKRDPARSKAKSIWLESGKSKPLKEIANELGKKPNQIRKWKSQDHWDIDDNSKKNTKRNTTNPKKERYQSKGTSKGNDDSALSPQQEAFAWLVGGKKMPLYRAYLEAYKVTGPSVASAMRESSRLNKNEKVHERIVEISQETARKYHWSTESVIDSYTFLHDESKADIVTNGVRKATADAMLQSLEDITDILGLKQLSKAQIRKANAEAEIVETKAKEIKKVEHHEDGTLVVDDLGGVNNGNEDKASD